MLYNFFGGNLDFLKIKKLNKVCSDDLTYTKMLKLCNLCKTIIQDFLFLLKWTIIAVSA